MLAVVVLSGGCGPRLRPVAWEDQVVRPMDGVAARRTQGVAAEVRPVEVPWTPRESLVAFHLTVRNVSDKTRAWNPADLLLEDGEGRLRRPLPIDALARSYRASGKRGPLPPGLKRAPAPGQATSGAGPDGAWSSPSCCCAFQYQGGPPHLSQIGLTGRSSPDSHPLLTGREPAAFLMRTPELRELGPGDSVSGGVVFSCPLERDAELVLSVPLPGATGPVDTSTPLRVRFVYR